MKMAKLLFLIAALASLSLHSNVQAQQVFKTTSSSVIAYYEYLPQDYNQNSDKYPIVFFMHGIGEKGPDSSDPAVLSQYIYKVAAHGPPQYVKNGTQFPFILISPQLKSNYSQWTSSYLLEVVNHVKTYLRIDEKRIYVTGLSLGGGGTWVTAQDHADFIAALAPVCGGYNSTSKACNLASENLPVWAFHGDADATVPYMRTVNMVNAINACTPTPSPLAKVTIYPGVGHNAWDYAYKPDHTIHNPNVYDWMLAQKNTKNAGNLVPTATAGADVSSSLSSNTITLSGSGSDGDGTITGYSWVKISGPAATLTNIATSNLSVSNYTSGTYIFKFTVTDNNGNTDTDYVKVTVSDVSSAPVANAGANKLIKLPTTSATIAGSATDNGTITAYRWTKISGAACTMSNTTSASLKISALTSGQYVFRLTVTDNDGQTASDDVTVNVDAPPVVNAGADASIALPTSSITLHATATDADGTIVKYLWSKYSGPNLKGGTNGSASYSVTNLVAGTYVFKLAVTDNLGAVSYDYVTVNVLGGL